MREKYKFGLMAAVFLAAYYTPFASLLPGGPALESSMLLQEYAREHVLLCLVPALFIAGAIACFVRQQSVIKYFGAKAKKMVSYSVASVSGAVLAVCSCTVLPLFAGIYSRGAGIGPASAFLYAGPAVNILAVILTARVLGPGLGGARALGAVAFSFVIGFSMHLIFRREEREKAAEPGSMEDGEEERPLARNAAFFAAMTGVLVFANFRAGDSGALLQAAAGARWYLTALMLGSLGYMLRRWFRKEELKEWMGSTWGFAKLILPLLFIGVLIAGLLLGRPGRPGLIPGDWITALVGGNSLRANLFASIAGALMYFATLTEVPILQGLIGSGMGQGPALALLLAGPALSLPNMLVIGSILGLKKTLVFTGLVIGAATMSGMVYGGFV